jgi:hypothetical protein
MIGNVPFPHGYCTSACEAGTDQCGPEGYCLDAGSFIPGLTGCVKTCTEATAEEDCRTDEGYQCTDFMGFIPTFFCAPPVSTGDA